MHRVSFSTSTLIAFFIGLVIGAAVTTGVVKRSAPPQVETAAKECPTVNQVVEETGGPEWISEPPVKSNSAGEIMIKWKAIDGAKKYQLRIVDKSGREAQTLKTSRTFAYIKDLLVEPGKKSTPYFVRVAVINEDLSWGPQSKALEIHAIPLNNLHAPKIKSITPEED